MILILCLRHFAGNFAPLVFVSYRCSYLTVNQNRIFRSVLPHLDVLMAHADGTVWSIGRDSRFSYPSTINGLRREVNNCDGSTKRSLPCAGTSSKCTRHSRSELQHFYTPRRFIPCKTFRRISLYISYNY